MQSELFQTSAVAESQDEREQGHIPLTAYWHCSRPAFNWTGPSAEISRARGMGATLQTTARFPRKNSLLPWLFPPLGSLGW